MLSTYPFFPIPNLFATVKPFSPALQFRLAASSHEVADMPRASSFATFARILLISISPNYETNPQLSASNFVSPGFTPKMPPVL